MRYPFTPTSAANIGRYVGELRRWQSTYGAELRTIQRQDKLSGVSEPRVAGRPHPQYLLIMHLAVIL